MKPVKKIKIEKSDLLSRYVQTLIHDLNLGGFQLSPGGNIANYSPTGKGVSLNVDYGMFVSEYHIVREKRMYRYTVVKKPRDGMMNGAPDISLPLRTFLNTINAL